MSHEQVKSDVEQISSFIMSGKQLQTIALATKSGHRASELHRWTREVIDYLKTSPYRIQIPKFLRLTRDYEDSNWDNGHQPINAPLEPRMYEMRLGYNQQVLQDCIQFLEDLIK